MGMYDHLRVEAALPDPEHQDRSFQTKSLECSLSDDTITADGRLLVRQVEYERTPEEEMPYYGAEAWERAGPRGLLAHCVSGRPGMCGSRISTATSSSPQP